MGSQLVVRVLERIEDALLEIRVIQLEIGLRELTLKPPKRAPVHTVLLHWVRGSALLETFPGMCLRFDEAMAEKLPRGTVAAGSGHSRLLRHRPRGEGRGA